MWTNIKNKLHSSKIRQQQPILSNERTTSTPIFRFLVNEPHFCIEQNYLYLIAVSSAPANFEKRMAIRNSWGNTDTLSDSHGAIVFLLGKVNKNMRLQKEIYEESMSYRDIIQGDFLDSYKNLTRKSLMALKWFSSYCSQVKFLMKTDDDIFINTRLLSKYLVEKEKQKRWLVGCVKTHAAYPIKMKKSKAIPILSLPYGHPTFLAGAGYIMSNDIVEPLYQISQSLKIVPVEDVFITGHCAKAIGVLPEHNSRFSCGEVVKDPCILAKTMFTGHRMIAEKQEEIWDLINDPKQCNPTNNVLKRM